MTLGKDTIVYGLQRIQKTATKERQTYLLTCGNQSLRIHFMNLSWTKTRSHLNQCFKYWSYFTFARESKQYKYVTFLESDVLYAEGHFDYPDFKGNSICNMNYKGLCEKGFQERKTA